MRLVRLVRVWTWDSDLVEETAVAWTGYVVCPCSGECK